MKILNKLLISLRLVVSMHAGTFDKVTQYPTSVNAISYCQDVLLLSTVINFSQYVLMRFFPQCFSYGSFPFNEAQGHLRFAKMSNQLFLLLEGLKFTINPQIPDEAGLERAGAAFFYEICFLFCRGLY